MNWYFCFLLLIFCCNAAQSMHFFHEIQEITYAWLLCVHLLLWWLWDIHSKLIYIRKCMSMKLIKMWVKDDKYIVNECRCNFYEKPNVNTCFQKWKRFELNFVGIAPTMDWKHGSFYFLYIIALNVKIRSNIIECTLDVVWYLAAFIYSISSFFVIIAHSTWMCKKNLL